MQWANRAKMQSNGTVIKPYNTGAPPHNLASRGLVAQVVDWCGFDHRWGCFYELIYKCYGDLQNRVISSAKANSQVHNLAVWMNYTGIVKQDSKYVSMHAPEVASYQDVDNK